MPGKATVRESERKIGQKSLLWFPQGETDEAEESGFGLAILNHFSGLWDLGVSLIFWALALRRLGQGDSGPSVQQRRRRACGLWIGGLHWKEILHGAICYLCELATPGRDSSSSPQDVKAWEQSGKGMLDT